MYIYVQHVYLSRISRAFVVYVTYVYVFTRGRARYCQRKLMTLV